MTAQHPRFIYKITTQALWDDATSNGTLKGMPIDEADGYMHFSTANQVGETLSLHFKGQSGLVLLCVPTDDVSEDLKWEPSRGGALFPHLFGALHTNKIAWSAPVSVDDDGDTELPELT